MGLAEHESEGHNEELVALIVADMQDPVTPILEAARVGEGLHDTGRMIARLSKILHYGAAAIDENLLGIGAVEIHLGHVRLPSNVTRDGQQQDVSIRGVLDGTARGWERRCCEDLKPHPSGYEREEDHLRNSRIAIAGP